MLCHDFAALRNFLVPPLFIQEVCMWTDLSWTPQCPDASQVYVTRFYNITEVEVVQGPNSVIVRIIVMPCKAGRVNKNGD